MRLLVTSAHPTIALYAGNPHIGRLVVPKDCARVADTARLMPWAADNAAYSGFDSAAFYRMLDAIQGVPGCLFVAVPDVVGDARATAEQFEFWAPALERRGLPLALVAQDGLDELPAWLEVTWHRLAALFIGGTTAFKMSDTARALVREAKRRGRHVHMGRVNSVRRLMYARSIGCDTADGSQFSLWRDTHLPRTLAWLASGEQLPLEPAC